MLTVRKPSHLSFCQSLTKSAGNVLSAALGKQDQKAINALVAHLVEEATHIVVSRQLLGEVRNRLPCVCLGSTQVHVLGQPDKRVPALNRAFFFFFLFFSRKNNRCFPFAQLSKALKTLPAEAGLALCESTVAEISKRLVSFEEPVSVIRELWADLLEAGEDFEEAARVLEGEERFFFFFFPSQNVIFSGIVLDSPHRQVKVHYKVEILVRIASLWLLEDDFGRAEEKIHKAATHIKLRKELVLLFSLVDKFVAGTRRCATTPSSISSTALL